jgi:hypothetical protein
MQTLSNPVEKLRLKRATPAMASIAAPMPRRHCRAMRIFQCLVALGAVAACATAPADAPAPRSAPTHSAAPSAHLAEMLVAAGGANAPNRVAVERAFGAADIVRQDGAGTALTYRLESCALLLLFAADSGNEMRLVETHPSARRPGEVTPTLAQCAAEVSARRR